MIVRHILTFILLWQTGTVFSQTYSKTQLIDSIPWGIAFDIAPDGRVFTTQKGGWSNQAIGAQIKVFDANGNFLSVFYDLSDSVNASTESGLLGITLDPNFSANHFVYAFYCYDSNPGNGDRRIRINRFTEVNNAGTVPTVIFDYDIPENFSTGHQGGNIHFRPSDSTHIYISFGDMHTDTLGYAAQLNNPYGKILRISKYPGDPPPPDNPFYDDGNPLANNCDWIWAYGLRNSFDFCFGPNDSLYATENGTTLYDEVNLITRGGFYGWPYCEGDYDADTVSLPCHAAGSISPLTTFPFPLPALTGILFYTDTVWSQQQNHLITGDFNHADLTDITLGNPPAYDQVSSGQFWIDESMSNGIVAIRQGPEGCIYVMEIADTSTGGIYMICPDANNIPENSSQNDAYISGPNPFSQSTTITYSLQQTAEVSISLFDALGRETVISSHENTQAGTHTVIIDAKKLLLAAGVYTCVISGPEFTVTMRLVLN